MVLTPKKVRHGENPRLHYLFGARFFDTELGIWLSPDPAGQFANPYGYVGDPINMVDPDGQLAQFIIGAVVGAAMGAVTCHQTDANFAATILGGAAVGAATGGIGLAAYEASGGSFIAAGAAGGSFAGTANYTINTAGNPNADYSIEGFAISAGIGAVSAGGDIYDVFYAGAIGAGVAMGSNLLNFSQAEARMSMQEDEKSKGCPTSECP